MIKLYDGGVYLVNGTDIVEANQDAAAVLTSKTGSAPSKEEAAKNTIAYSILRDHNTSGNMDKLKIKEAIIVEGRDDAAVLHQVTDALIIETHGFGIKKSTWDLMKKAHSEKGLIILTDPDFSGEEIRKRILFLHRLISA